MKNSLRYLTVARVCEGRICHVVCAPSRSWEMKQKKSPQPSEIPPWLSSFHLLCNASYWTVIPWRVLPENHCIALFFFPRRTSSPIHYIDTSSTVWLPLREMRLQFNLQQEQQAAWRVSCGTRLVAEACASTPSLRQKGMEGGNSDSPPFVEGADPAASPRRSPHALCFTGFSISNNAKTPTIFGRKLVNLFPGALGWRATWLERTGGDESRRVSFSNAEERRVIRLHFGIVIKDPLGKRSHIISSKKKIYIRWNALLKLSRRRERWHAAEACVGLIKQKSAWEKKDKNVITCTN